MTEITVKRKGGRNEGCGFLLIVAGIFIATFGAVDSSTTAGIAGSLIIGAGFVWFLVGRFQ